MSERPKDLPPLDLERVNEIRDLLRYQSSVHFSSDRAHQSMWMLHAFAEAALTPEPELGPSGHDLVVSYGDCEFYGACSCGKPLGSIKPDKSIDELGLAWERHVMTEVPR